MQPACTSCLLQFLLKPVPVSRATTMRMNGAKTGSWLREKHHDSDNVSQLQHECCWRSCSFREAKRSATQIPRHEKVWGEKDDDEHPLRPCQLLLLLGLRCPWAKQWSGRTAQWQIAGGMNVAPGRMILDLCINSVAVCRWKVASKHSQPLLD